MEDWRYGREASITWTTITLDCSDAEALGAFYARLFGWGITARDGTGWVQLRDPHGGVGLSLQAEDWYEPPGWPERSGHRGKMMHFEVLVDDLDAAVQLVLQGGGSEAAYQPPDRDPTRLRVMLDPAGHPFASSSMASSRLPREALGSAPQCPRGQRSKVEFLPSGPVYREDLEAAFDYLSLASETAVVSVTSGGGSDR